MFMKRFRARRHGQADMPLSDGSPIDASSEQCGESVTLCQAKAGHSCRVKRHRTRGAIRQRLLDLGFLPNAEVEVVRVATLGDPIEVRIGGYFVALRREEAGRIDVDVA